MDILFRMISLVVLVSVFSISAYFRSKARNSGETVERRDEGWLALLIRMVGGFGFLSILLANIFFPNVLRFSEFSLPVGVKVVAALFAVSCIPLILWVFRSIGENISETVLIKPNHKLVKLGPYRWIRHPLYSSALLMLFTLGLMLEDWILLVITIAGVIIFRAIVIPAEELRLIDRFGDDYRAYKKTTGALLPRIRESKSAGMS